MTEVKVIVPLTQEQINAIENARTSLYDWEIVTFHAKSSDLWDGNNFPLRQLSMSTLLNALYIGYELQKTPEEKVKEYYDGLSIECKDIVTKTLTELNITVKGVNDNAQDNNGTV